MKQFLKRIGAAVLSLAMLCALLPAAAFAEGKTVEVEFWNGDNYYGDDRMDIGYIYKHPDSEIVITPEDPSRIEATEGSTIKLPKAATVDMTEEEINDSTTKPYFYIRNSQGVIETKMICKEIVLLANTGEQGGQHDTVITTETNKENEYELPVGWAQDGITNPDIMIMYYWYKETPPKPHKVSYNYNVGTGVDQLPGDAEVYPGELLLESGSVPYPDFAQSKVISTGTVITQEMEKADYAVSSFEDDRIADLVGRTGDETGGYTYYAFLGWKSSADDKLYQIGDTAVMGDEEVTYTAQWAEIPDSYWNTDKFEQQGLVLPLTQKYSDSDYPGGTDAEITQKSTSGGYGRANDTADNPLLLDDDRTVSYKATMRMSSLVAEECLGNQKITNEEFANFKIHVQIGDQLTVLDQDEAVDFTFTCTFLKPTGEVIFGDTSQTYPFTTNGNSYTFSVPASEFTSNSFDIPVKWIPGSHSADDLMKPIVLEVAKAKINNDYTGVVETKGYITGSINFDLVADSLKLYKITSLQLADSTWKKAFDRNTDGRISVAETMLAYKYIKSYAKDNINLSANSVYAQYRPEAIVQPADITIYMGGTSGYDGVATDDGEISGSNSLPEPGYYITLPDEINQALEDLGYTVTTESGTEPSDLSKLITIYTMGADTPHTWTLKKYGDTYSAAQGKYIYAIVPAEGTDPFRLNFTNKSDESVTTSDTFAPAEESSLYSEYTMNIYSELVDKNQVVLEVKLKDKIYYCTMNTKPGYLNVRYVTGSQESVVTPAYTDIVHASDADDPNKTALDKAYVIKTPETKFYINSSDVDVTEGGQFAQVSLLFDDIVSSANTEGVDDYHTALTEKAIEVVASDFQNPQYEAKYLNLVDANNGNVWLKPSQTVTVYWPYPEGTDENTTFRLAHFDGMDRDMATGEVMNAIQSAKPESVASVQTDEYGIYFETDSFSPYVLLWDKATPAVDDGGKEESTAPAATPKPTPAPAEEAQPVAAPVAAVIPQTGDESQPLVWVTLVVLSGAALAGLAVYRKKRSDK